MTTQSDVESLARDIIGKTVSAVIYITGTPPPLHHLFLVFDDETYCEIYVHEGLWSVSPTLHGASAHELARNRTHESKRVVVFETGEEGGPDQLEFFEPS